MVDTMAWLYTSSYALIGAGLSTIGLVGIGAMLSIWAWYHIAQRLSTRSTLSKLYSRKPDFRHVQSGSTSITKEDICRVDVDGYVLITDELCPATVTAGVGTLRQVAVSSLHDLLLGLATLRPQGEERENSTPSSSTPTEDTDRDVVPHTQDNVSMPRPNTERRMSLLNRHLPVCETLEGAYVPASDIPAYMVTSGTETINIPTVPMMSASVGKPAPSAALSPLSRMNNHSAHVRTTTSPHTDAFRAYVSHQVEAIFPKDSMRRETFLSIVEEILFASTAQLVIDAVFRAFRVTVGVLRHWELENTLVGAFPREAQGEITYQVQFILNTVNLTWDKHKYGSDLMQAMSQIAQHLRDHERQPTCSEYLAFQLAYYKLSKGHRLDLSAHMSMGSPGFHPHTQTYISFTDPGEGHVLGTTRYTSWMQGVVINVETPPEEHAADKQPSLLDLSKVRLHTGSAAPTSISVGTVVNSEYGGFDEQFGKTVLVISSEATAAFHRGAAEYKVTMDGLTLSQVVRYMRALTSNISRERFSQHLSAAWTLNQIVFDDYEREKPRHLVSTKDIAMRILDITSLGGFDAVCLTGGGGDSDLKDMLGFEEALVFSHQAHMLGLATHVCGVKFDEIRHSVFAGIDSIGIGGGKALRFKDSESGILGPPTDIQQILQSRDKNAKSVRGRGAHLLVRLDTMLYEGTISQQQNILREHLLKALKSNRKAEIENLLNELHVVCCEATTSSHVVEGTAYHLCRATEPLLQQCAESPTEWRVFIARVRLLLHAKDYPNLVEEYESEPWLTYRQKYTDQLRAMAV